MTFGCLAQFGKVHDELLRCWAALLQSVPGSKLLLVCPDGNAAEYTRNVFCEFAVEPERILLVPPCGWADYVQLFERVDIALDPYPCNGMTTTCHCLHMGVPIVTLSGATADSRAGESLLHTLGEDCWIARDWEEYRIIARELASDLGALAGTRAALRQRLAASPLMDAPRFARHVEAAYQAIWHTLTQSPG